jgi:hypothetical protein
MHLISWHPHARDKNDHFFGVVIVAVVAAAAAVVREHTFDFFFVSIEEVTWPRVGKDGIQ